MADGANCVARLPVTTLMPGLLARIEAGADDVDRGLRPLATEVADLGACGLLAGAAGIDEPGGRWLAAGSSPQLYRQIWELGRASLPVARLFEGHVDALALVFRLGSNEAREIAQCLADKGGLLGVWGADQPGNPSLCVPDGEGVVLQGGKAFASGLGLVELAVVTARNMDARTQLLLVSVTDPNRQDAGSWDMDGMVGTVSGRMRLDGLGVPSSLLLGAPDALFAEPYFHGGLWRILAAQAGAIDGLAYSLLNCLRERGQDSDPLQRHRLAKVIMEAATADHWARATASAVAQDGAGPDAIETALFAREAVEQAALRAMDHAERAAGTAMHVKSGALSRISRDLRVYLRQASLDTKLNHALELWQGRAAGIST